MIDKSLVVVCRRQTPTYLLTCRRRYRNSRADVKEEKEERQKTRSSGQTSANAMKTKHLKKEKKKRKKTKHLKIKIKKEKKKKKRERDRERDRERRKLYCAPLQNRVARFGDSAFCLGRLRRYGFCFVSRRLRPGRCSSQH